MKKTKQLTITALTISLLTASISSYANYFDTQNNYRKQVVRTLNKMNLSPRMKINIIVYPSGKVADASASHLTASYSFICKYGLMYCTQVDPR